MQQQLDQSQRRQWQLCGSRPFVLAAALTIFLSPATAIDAAEPGSPPTFSNEVVRILQANCQHCHQARTREIRL